MSDIGIVVIGRNEGDRLVRCLRSIEGAGERVYVDSGSTDRSIATAAALGARVVMLDMSMPFTAARARNAGAAALGPEISYVQFVDGDCAVQPGWIVAARSALDADPGLGAAFGRRREIDPGASVYNWLCDVEWAIPPGPARACGGDVMMRRAALDAAGGYPDVMIAGEEPDLSLRMRSLGWKILCLPVEMTLHDAAMTRFGQWWRRSIRAGHAFAELADRHPRSPLHTYDKSVRSALLWGSALPLVAAAGFLMALVSGGAVPLVIGLGTLALIGVQALRILNRERRQRPFGEALRRASFLMLAKPAEATGIWRYWRGRWSGRRAAIIEYKDTERPA